MSATEQSIAAPTSAPTTGEENLKWYQMSAATKAKNAERLASAGEAASRFGTSAKNTLTAGAKLTGNFLVEFHKQHKTSGIIFMIVAFSIFVTAIVDISAVSANGYLKWDSSVTAEQAAHRDRSITTLVFAIILFLFMIVKEFNYAIAKMPVIGRFLEM